MKRDAFPSRVGSVLERVFKSLGIDKKMRQLQALDQWREVVGEKINLHTRPLAIRKKSLFVLVDSSSWLAQLSYIKHKIISEFDRRYGEGVVENIYFRLGEVKKARSGKIASKDTSPSHVLRRILIKDGESSKGSEEIPHHSPE